MLCYQPLWEKMWTSVPSLPWKRETQEELISSQILFWNHPAVVTTCLAVNVIQVLQEIWKSVTIQSSRFFIDIHNHLSQVLLRNFSKAFFKSFSFYMKHQTQTRTRKAVQCTMSPRDFHVTFIDVMNWISQIVLEITSQLCRKNFGCCLAVGTDGFWHWWYIPLMSNPVKIYV